MGEDGEEELALIDARAEGVDRALLGFAHLDLDLGVARLDERAERGRSQKGTQAQALTLIGCC